MGQAFYRKYRSRSLDAIVGQEHIVTALKNAVQQGRISHAYLFTGPRGVGKTSIARILAHEINHLPYADEHAHIDIVEIDAASNRGIDEIRDLREKVYIAPTSGSYKVYIIDEVHMLTPQAFNALLKTLEEPPAHVVFILATTEAHKLPPTIISRTQRYTFRPAEREQLINHLRFIADSEKVKISDEALSLIAEHGDGSFRDSVGLLDQVAHGDKPVEAADVHDLLGIPPQEVIAGLIANIAAADVSSVMTGLEELTRQGYQAAAIAKKLSEQLRASVLEDNLLLPAEKTFDLMTQLLEVSTSSNPHRSLEIALLRQAADHISPPQPIAKAEPKAPIAAKPVKPEKKSDKTAKEDAKPVVDEPPKSDKPKTESPASDKESGDAPTKTPTTAAPAKDGALDKNRWGEVLGALKAQYNTLYSIVRMAEPEFEGDKAVLTFSFMFHQKRLNEAKNKAIVSAVLSQVYGREVELECHFDKSAKPAPAAIVEPAGGSLDTISNIFGGGELLES